MLKAYRLEEVVTLVVYQDECGEIFYCNFPYRLHAELGVFNALDTADAALGKYGSNTAGTQGVLDGDINEFMKAFLMGNGAAVTDVDDDLD